MIDFEESSGNIYADLGMNDADEMLVKAQLATKIGAQAFAFKRCKVELR